MRRAHHPEQRTERRAALLRAAEEMFDAGVYADVTIHALAKRAGVAKGTVYLYFQTKEQIFFELLERQISDWFDAVTLCLQPLREQRDLRLIAKKLSASLRQRKSLIRLSCLVKPELTSGAHPGAELTLRRNVLPAHRAACQAVERCLPDTRQGDGVRILRSTWALLVGLMQLQKTSVCTHEVANDTEEPDELAFDLTSEYEQSVLMILLGHQALRVPDNSANQLHGLGDLHFLDR